jgi:hypothetical protein
MKLQLQTNIKQKKILFGIKDEKNGFFNILEKGTRI